MSTVAWAMVRHGQTEWNLQRRLQGSSDIPLNNRGREQAERAADHLSSGVWDVVVCSPLARARETAQIIASRLDLENVVEVPDLVERCYGAMEGRSVKYLDGEAKHALMQKGEAEQDVIERGISALVRLRTDYPQQRLVIVSHSSLLRLVMGELTGRAHTRITNGEVLILQQELVPAGR
ncbi:histidine phosphatase family protein [Arthrobacter sp. TMP15]|uniref:histidine phosphatase family protein n=1 Tax=Arthrobacter sp. TMP15 TaxID=3140789 RepID=UPI0031BB2B00